MGTQFNSLIEIYKRPTLVAMVTKILGILNKMGYNSAFLYKSCGQESCIKQGVFKVAQFNSIIEIYQRLNISLI